MVASFIKSLIDKYNHCIKPDPEVCLVDKSHKLFSSLENIKQQLLTGAMYVEH